MSPLICKVTTVSPPMHHRIFHKEALSLVRAGYRVVILAQGAKAGTVQGVRFEPLPPRAQHPWQRWSRLISVWRRARALHADVYHLYDPELMVVGLLLKRDGYRVIQDVRENFPLHILSKAWIPWGWLRNLIARLYDPLERFCLARYDGIVAAFEDIAQRFPNARHLTIVKNFPEVDHWIPANPDAGPEVIAVYVGDLTRPRGILEMVQAVTQLDAGLNVRLWIVGGFPHPDYEAEVHTAADERVRFFGRVPHDELPGLLAQCHIGMLTLYPIQGHLDAWPVKLFEYMAAGLPIVTSDIPLWTKLAGESGVVVKSVSPADIAEVLTDLAQNPARRGEMGRRGRELVDQEFNWASQVSNLLDLYAQVVGPPVGPGNGDGPDAST